MTKSISISVLVAIFFCLNAVSQSFEGTFTVTDNGIEQSRICIKNDSAFITYQIKNTRFDHDMRIVDYTFEYCSIYTDKHRIYFYPVFDLLYKFGSVEITESDSSSCDFSFQDFYQTPNKEFIVTILDKKGEQIFKGIRGFGGKLPQRNPYADSVFKQEILNNEIIIKVLGLDHGHAYAIRITPKLGYTYIFRPLLETKYGIGSDKNSYKRDKIKYKNNEIIWIRAKRVHWFWRIWRYKKIKEVYVKVSDDTNSCDYGPLF